MDDDIPATNPRSTTLPETTLAQITLILAPGQSGVLGSLRASRNAQTGSANNRFTGTASSSSPVRLFTDPAPPAPPSQLAPELPPIRSRDPCINHEERAYLPLPAHITRQPWPPHHDPSPPTPLTPASTPRAEGLVDDEDSWTTGNLSEASSPDFVHDLPRRRDRRPRPPAQNMWECDTCEVTLPTAERESHLMGEAHWEQEALLEVQQRREWEDIQAAKELQACFEMEERERWEMEEMEREVDRIDQMCREEERVRGLIEEEGTEETVDFEMDEGERLEMEELAREVRRIDDMCREEEERIRRAGGVHVGVVRDIGIGLQVVEQRNRQSIEEGHEVIRVADTNIQSQREVSVNSPARSPRPVHPVRPRAEIDRISDIPYSAESSRQGAERGPRQNILESLESQGAPQQDELWETIADAERHSRQRIQPPLNTPWFLPPVASLMDLPPVLYRVYDNTSVSKYTWRGFAPGSPSPPLTAAAFKLNVQNHANWSSRQPTPFVSVTTSPDAVSWHIAKKQSRGTNTNIMVALIDTAALLGAGGARAWKMLDAMDHAGVVPWRGDRRVYVNEIICAGGIPAGVVFGCCRPVYFKEAALAFVKSLE